MIWKVLIKSHSRYTYADSCKAHRRGLLQWTQYCFSKTQMQHHVETIADISQDRKAHWRRDVYWETNHRFTTGLNCSGIILPKRKKVLPFSFHPQKPVRPPGEMAGLSSPGWCGCWTNAWEAGKETQRGGQRQRWGDFWQQWGLRSD